MKKLENSSDSNREVILLSLQSEDGAVPLTDKQKELKIRWEKADELIRRNEMKRETIAKMLMNIFNISRQTAYQDIVNAEAVYGSSAPLNKKYRIGLRIEFLEGKINELYENLEPEPVQLSEGDEPEDILAKVARIKQNKEYLFEAAQLEKVLAKYYEMYPDTTPPRSPKKIILNVQQNILPAAPMTAQEALEKARKIININPRKDDGTATDA